MTHENTYRDDNWELKKMVQIVGNLEWELLKNVEIRKSIYARITNTRFVDPLFKNFAYIKKNHTCDMFSTENCAVY
jgi:hypothetical protein